MGLVRCLAIFITLGLVQFLIPSTTVLSQNSHYSLTLIIYNFSGDRALFEPPSTLPLVTIRKIGGESVRQQIAKYNRTVTLCKFDGLDAGEYEVEIFWKGIKVYRNDNVSLYENKTLIAYCNVNLVSFRIVDVINNPIKQARVELLYQETMTQLDNITADYDGYVSTLLPFGDYVIVATYMKVGDVEIKTALLKQSFIRVNSSGTHIFTIDGKVQSCLVLEVSPLDIELLTDDGTPLSLEAIKKLKLMILKDDRDLLCFTLNHSRLYIEQLPSGTYTLKVFWQDYCFDKKLLDHYPNGGRFIKINLKAFVEVRFVDEADIPLTNATVTVISPWGEKWNFITDSRGGIHLTNIPYGNYMMLVRVKNYPQVTLNVTISSPDFYKERVKELLTITLRITRRGARDTSVPRGIKLVFSVDETLKGETILEGRTITLSNIPRGVLKLHLMWQGVEVGALEELLTSSGEILVECEIYELRITVTDLDDDAVEGCIVRIEHPNGTRIEQITDANGVVYWKYLPRGEYSIAIIWSGVVVHKEKLHLFSDLSDKLVVLKLKTFHIKVIDILNQPVPDTEVILKPIVSKGTSFEYNISSTLYPTATFDSSFLFEKALLLTDSYKLTVKVGGRVVKTEVVRLGKDVNEITVKCLVLVLPGGYVITKYDIPFISGLVVSITLLVVVLTKYWKLLQLRRVFVEATPSREKVKEEKSLTSKKVLSGVRHVTIHGKELLAKLKVKEKSEVSKTRAFFRPPVKKESYGVLKEAEEEYEEYEEYEELFE